MYLRVHHVFGQGITFCGWALRFLKLIRPVETQHGRLVMHEGKRGRERERQHQALVLV
jgi:hypothetical protein